MSGKNMLNRRTLLKGTMTSGIVLMTPAIGQKVPESNLAKGHELDPGLLACNF